MPKYYVGDRTMAAVFRPANITNLGDLQAVLDQMEKALEAAEQPSQEAPTHMRARIKGEPVSTITCQYRSLRLGEKIAAGDELLKDDCITWQRVGTWCAGMPYQPNVYRPIRRLTGQRLEMHK